MPSKTSIILALSVLEYIATVALITTEVILQEVNNSAVFGTPLAWTLYFSIAWGLYIIFACIYFKRVRDWIVSFLTFIPPEAFDTEDTPIEQVPSEQLTQWTNHYKTDYAVLAILAPKLMFSPVIILTYNLESTTRFYEYMTIYPCLSCAFVPSMIFYIFEVMHHERSERKKRKKDRKTTAGEAKLT